jgi:hypothetical protein
MSAPPSPSSSEEGQRDLESAANLVAAGWCQRRFLRSQPPPTRSFEKEGA